MKETYISLCNFRDFREKFDISAIRRLKRTLFYSLFSGHIFSKKASLRLLHQLKVFKKDVTRVFMIPKICSR